MFDEALGQSFLTFSLGFLGAVVLAMVVNPVVARKAERRSRWLDRALQALEHLRWDIEPALAASRTEAMTSIPLRNEHRLCDRAEVIEALDRWSDSEQESFDVMSRSVNRTSTLMRYVCHAHPRNDALAQLDLKWKAVELYVRGIWTVRMDVATTQDEVEFAYNGAQASLAACSRVLEKMALSGHPPRRSAKEVVRRWRMSMAHRH